MFLDINNLNLAFLLPLQQIMKDLRRHPYIASLSEVIRNSESTTLILEYISSTPYLHGIQKWSNYTEADAQTSLKQLLKAINYCHKHKIMHRVSNQIYSANSHSFQCQF